MRVTSTSFSVALMSQLQNIGQRQAQLQNQVSTGLRISNLSDDPAAMGRVLNSQTEIQQIQQFAHNNDFAMEVSKTTFASVNEMKTISDRAGELALLGGGPTSADSSKAYAAETNQMLEQMVQVANTKYNGNYIFGGTATDQPPFEAQRDANGNITSVSYVGAASAAQFEVGEGSITSPYTNGVTNQQFADFANNLVALRDALKNQNPAALTAAQGQLQTSEDDLLNTVSDIGAVQTRLEANAAENQSRFSSLQGLSAQDTNIDLATTMVKMSQSQTAYSAAAQAGAKILQNSLLDYLH